MPKKTKDNGPAIPDISMKDLAPLEGWRSPRISEEDWEKYLKQRRAELKKDVARLKNKDLTLTISPMKREMGFKVEAAINKKRFNFYVHVPFRGAFPIPREHTHPNGTKVKVETVVLVEGKVAMVEEKYRPGPPTFATSHTFDEKDSPAKIVKKLDPDLGGPRLEPEAEYVPIDLAINSYVLSDEDHDTLRKVWYPNKLGPGAKEYLPDRDNPYPHMDPKGLDYFGGLLKRILEGIGYKVTIETLAYYPITKETFAFPSHPAMFTLLALFAGKTERIPRKLLEKPYDKRSKVEQKKAEEFMNSIIKLESRNVYDENGQEMTEDKRVAIISDNPKVEGRAKIVGTLFSHDIQFREGALALYIKRTFGAEGLRHLLGIIIGLEENFRKGYFEWTVNDHLKRLGYKRKKKGTFSSGAKETATAIVGIFASLFITASMKKGSKGKISGRRLFSIDGFDIETDTFEDRIINESLILRATDFWYRNAFEPQDGTSPQFTKLLRKIACENHRNRPLTFFISPLLAMYWRINKGKPMRLKVTNLMQWCDLDAWGAKRTDHLKDLEGELDYMKQAGYLGEWSHTGEATHPSEGRKPFEHTLTLYPPRWLEKELGKILGGKGMSTLPPSKEENPLLTHEDFKRIFDNLGLSQNQLANRIGITRQMVNYLLNNKRKISKELSDKIWDTYGHLLPM